MTAAERLLQELGVTEPTEIDLEAIAWHVGVSVKHRELDGCEARIVGHEDKAIITVRAGVSLGRKRFSIGHELGHWHHHRGRTLICRSEDIGLETTTKPTSERTADQYAADLLLPTYLFRPQVEQRKKLTWQNVRELSELFSTSITATAIRIIDLDLFPALLVCHGKAGRRWFRRAHSVPERWFPQDQLDPDSFAFDVLYGAATDGKPHLIEADAWFDRREAAQYQLLEDSIKVVDEEVLTLLIPKNERMLAEVDDSSWRRGR